MNVRQRGVISTLVCLVQSEVKKASAQSQDDVPFLCPFPVKQSQPNLRLSETETETAIKIVYYSKTESNRNALIPGLLTFIPIVFLSALLCVLCGGIFST